MTFTLFALLAREYERALFDGPWIIADHYLAVSKCFHDLEPEHFNVTNLAVWVRFPNSPMDYFEESFLWKIANKIGRPLRVDLTTVSAVRGRFARVCVEVDLSKPMLSKFRLKRRTRKIEYEGMHIICFECGRYGRYKENCKERTTTDGEVHTHHEPPMEVQEQPGVAEEITDKYGKWMVVKKNPKKYGGRMNTNINYGVKSNDKSNGGNSSESGAKDGKWISKVDKEGDVSEKENNGNKFLVLNELFGEEFLEENTEEPTTNKISTSKAGVLAETGAMRFTKKNL